MDPYDRLQAIKESSLKQVGKDLAKDAFVIARSLPIAARDISKYVYGKMTGKLPQHSPGIESASPEEFMKHIKSASPEEIMKHHTYIPKLGQGQVRFKNKIHNLDKK